MVLRHVGAGAPVAVVDVESTGFYNKDRVVEVAIVRLDSAGRLIDEYETLVNPCRDVGPSSVHGVTASMVAAAPVFDEVAGTILDRLAGCVIVGHNVAFDVRFLANEYERMGWVLPVGEPVCTMELAG